MSIARMLVIGGIACLATSGVLCCFNSGAALTEGIAGAVLLFAAIVGSDMLGWDKK